VTARIILLVTSPRLPVGLLTAGAWDAVRAHPVLAGAEGEWTAALRLCGAEVTVVDPHDAVEALVAAAETHGAVVWLAGPAGDQEMARSLGLRLARRPGLADLELLYGSWDPPGARLLDAVAVIDRLASPGGDPWKRAQTHQSLARFLLEEAYEAYDAIVAGDSAALRDELGDVLLQVLLHARFAEEAAEDERWNVDDVAGGLVAKMIRRNPHVFAGASAGTLDEITENWERIKQEEKPRESVLEGISATLPTLAYAGKVLERSARLGVPVPSSGQVEPELAADADRLGGRLLALVAAAREHGVDAEAALRAALLAHTGRIRDAEQRAAGDRVG